MRRLALLLAAWRRRGLDAPMPMLVTLHHGAADGAAPPDEDA